MRLFPKELDIALDEGFIREKDIFRRHRFGKQLTALVKNVEGPLVILFDSDWGTGKTTFVRMWAGELQKQGCSSIYFDAFASDYQPNAFISLASLIIDKVNDTAQEGGAEKEQFLRAATRAGKVLLRIGAKVAVKAATAGAIEVGDLHGYAAEIAKTAGDDAADAIGHSIKSRLENHRAELGALSEFRMALERVVIQVNKALVTEKAAAPKAKLVFIIDELDRCKPSFALDVIETIKHMFSVNGVYFFLVAGLSQIASAVRHAYGDIDARKYLEKFYHIRVSFPAEHDAPTGVFDIYTRELGFDEDAYDVLRHFHRVHTLSLRNLERISIYYKLIAINRPNGINLALVTVIVCILKALHPLYYALLREGKLSFQQLSDYLEFMHWRANYQPRGLSEPPMFIVHIWQYLLEPGSNNERMTEFFSKMTSYGLNRENIVSHYCETIDSFLLD